MINQKLASLEARIARLESGSRIASTNEVTVGSILLTMGVYSSHYYLVVGITGTASIVVQEIEKTYQSKGYDENTGMPYGQYPDGSVWGTEKPNPSKKIGSPIPAKWDNNTMKGKLKNGEELLLHKL